VPQRLALLVAKESRYLGAIQRGPQTPVAEVPVAVLRIADPEEHRDLGPSPMAEVCQGMSAAAGWALAADNMTLGNAGQLPVEFGAQEGLQEPQRPEAASTQQVTAGPCELAPSARRAGRQAAAVHH